jgi:hypothetical protein
MLLHVWMGWVGTSEFATQSLSAIIGLLCVPAAFWAGNVMMGRRVAWAAAAIAAVDPFLTLHAYETRMYALLVLLGILASTAFVLAYVQRRALWRPVFGVLVALMLYTHNWSLFFGAACVVAFAWLVWKAAAADRRALLRDGVIGFGVTALLYAPWLPTLAFQAKHTGAPWSTRPSLHDLVLSAGSVLGGDAPFVALVLVGGVVLWGVVEHERGEGRTIIVALTTMTAVTIVAAFISSQISPAWTTRYFAVIAGPMLLLAGHGIARARALGFAALVAIVFLFAGYSVHNDKENARGITRGLAYYLKPGELIISTHPEQTPVLRYYLGPGYRWATTLGPTADPQIFDWRDAVSRLRAARARETMDGLLAGLKPGQEFVVIAPVFRDYRAWRAKWTKLVWTKATAWNWILEHDPRYGVVAHVASDEIALKENYFKPLQAFVYKRLR